MNIEDAERVAYLQALDDIWPLVKELFVDRDYQTFEDYEDAYGSVISDLYEAAKAEGWKNAPATARKWFYEEQDNE